jgi:hypothetical protein
MIKIKIDFNLISFRILVFYFFVSLSSLHLYFFVMIKIGFILMSI